MEKKFSIFLDQSKQSNQNKSSKSNSSSESNLSSSWKKTRKTSLRQRQRPKMIHRYTTRPVTRAFHQIGMIYIWILTNCELGHLYIFTNLHSKWRYYLNLFFFCFVHLNDRSSDKDTSGGYLASNWGSSSSSSSRSSSGGVTKYWQGSFDKKK